MFYKLIKNKSDEWFETSECSIKPLLQYIQSQNKMRDAQFEAIKIYLYLKIACQNKPLWLLFCEGVFNSLNLQKIPLTAEARTVLEENKAAVALLEFSMLKDKTGKQVAPDLEAFIKERASEIDYEGTFKPKIRNYHPIHD